ncbi:M28 family peptidase [Sporosarcina sp. NPDC096371]|uniref:M28 family peptidase n=1 Tax=Sporosarcina sp. NPDC096371 TaxID=3364530 RepID=UPI0037FC10D9
MGTKRFLSRFFTTASIMLLTASTLGAGPASALTTSDIAVKSQAEMILPERDAMHKLLTNVYDSTSYVNAGNTNYSLNGVSASSIKLLIERFESEGEFANSVAARALKTHMTALELYEKQANADKIVKHMNGFLVLLEQQHSKQLLSGTAYQALKDSTDEMVGQWDTTFSSDRAMTHLHNLSIGIGPRVTGTAEERQGVEYIKNEFEKLGYDVSTQEFKLPDLLTGQLQITSNDNQNVRVAIADGSGYTDENGVTGQLYAAGLGTAEDFTADAKGKIALIQRGDFTFWEKVQNATAAGATGVIIYDNVNSSTPILPGLSNKSSIPVVGITKANGEDLLSQMTTGEVEANLVIHADSTRKSQNVIAVKKPKNIENPEIVYVTSHHDSVAGSPGANDNGSGTSTVLEIARAMQNVPVDKEIRFIAFGAEEIGLVGSTYYVSQLSQDEINRSIVNYNLDMVGTNWAPASQLYVNTVDGKKNLVWDTVSAASKKLNIDDGVLNPYQFSRSDHVPFHDAGIDAALFIWMEPGTARMEPYYHTPQDSIENVSPERIQTIGDIITTAVTDLTSTQAKVTEKAS